MLTVLCIWDWRLLRDIKETEVIMLLSPQGGNLIEQLAHYPQLWVSFMNVESKNVVRRG